MRGRFVFCPPQSVDRRGFLRDALAQTSELGGVTTGRVDAAEAAASCTDL